MLFVLLALFVWRLHTVGLISFDYHYAKNYDKKEDRPSMEELERLMSELTVNLLEVTRVSRVKKSGVVGSTYVYFNLTDHQKLQLTENLQAHPKWHFQERKEIRGGHSDHYCFNQFELVIEVDRFDFTSIGKGAGEDTALNVDWWDAGECRSKFLQRRYQ